MHVYILVYEQFTNLLIFTTRLSILEAFTFYFKGR